MRQKILVPKYLQYIILPLALVFGAWFIGTVMDIVIMFTLAALIAFVLDLPVSLLERKLRLPRVIGALLTWLVILGLIAGGLALIIPNLIEELNSLITNLPEYAAKAGGLSDRLQGWFAGLNTPYKLEFSPEDLSGRLESVGTTLAQKFLDIAHAMLNIGINAVLIFIISMYILLDANHLRESARSRLPAAFRDDIIRLFGRMQAALGSYLRGQLFVSAVMGIIGGLIAWYGGSSEYIFIIAVWVAITEIVPLIGPFLGATPAVIIAWFSVSPERALVVALLFLIAQQLESHILVPRVMGKSVGVHPLWVMFAVLCGGALAGIMGALLAIPLVAVIKVLIDFFREEMILEKWDRPLLEKTTVDDNEPA